MKTFLFIPILIIYSYIVLYYEVQSVQIKKLVKQQVRGSCGDYSSLVAKYPYKQSYAEMGGTQFFGGYSQASATFWMKLDTDSANIWKSIFFLQKTTASDTTLHTLSMSYNPYNNNIWIRHNNGSELLENKFTTNGNLILNKGSWVFITIGISEDDSKIYLSGYYPNYKAGPVYFTELSYSSGPAMTPFGFDFASLFFYVANRGSGTSYESMCGAIQNFDLIMGYYANSVYSTYNYLHQGTFGSSYYGNTELLNIKMNKLHENESFIQDLSQYQNRLFLSDGEENVMIQSDGVLQFTQSQYIEIIDDFKLHSPYFIDTDYSGYQDVIDSVSFTLSYLVNLDTIVEATILERYDEQNNLVLKVSHYLQGAIYKLRIKFYVLDVNSDIVETTSNIDLDINQSEWHRITLMFYNGQFANDAPIPFYNFFLTGILDNTVILNNEVLVENSPYKNSFLLQKGTDQMRIGSSEVDESNTGSFQLREFQIYSGVQILLDTDISSEISNCILGLVIEDSLQCLQCDSTYVLNGNSCSLTCPDATYDIITEPDYCVSNKVCHYRCTTCDPLTPDTCLTCTGAQRNLANDCRCNAGYFDVFGSPDCQQFVKSQNYTIGTFTMSVDSVTSVESSLALNAAKNNGTYTQVVLFEKPLYHVPDYLGISVFQWQKTDNHVMEYQINYIPESLTRFGFTAQLDLYNDTKIEYISFQYISSDDFYHFRAGQATYTYYSGNVGGSPEAEIFSDLAIDNNLAKYVDVLVTDIPWSANTPFQVLAYLKSFRDIDNTRRTAYQCEVLTPSIPGITISFTIRLHRLAQARAKELQCGYIIVPSSLASNNIQHLFAASEYVYSIDPSPLPGYATTSYDATISTAIPKYTQLYFATIYALNYEQQSGITGNTIEFGFRTGVRTSDTVFKMQAINDNNRFITLDTRYFVPLQICKSECESCIYETDGQQQAYTCKTCNPALDPTNRLLEPPNCGCIEKYFEDPSDRLCYECTNVKCNQCIKNVDFCLGCVGNRIPIPGVRETSGPPFCNCLEGEREYLYVNQPMCGNCTYTEPLLVELSKDYTVIKIIFDYELDIVFFLDQLNPQSKMREPLTSTCELLFDGEFVELLGIEPTCYLGEDNDGNADHAIIISIGGKPLIFPDETVVINPNTLRDRNLEICQVDPPAVRTDSFDLIKPMNITYSVIPEPLPDPIIELNVPETPVTICPELKLSLKKVYNDLNYGVKLFTWKFLTITPEDNTLLDKLNELALQFKNKKSFDIPPVFLNENSVYTFELYFRTYMGTENTQEFSFETGGTEGLITYIEQQNFDLYIWQEVSIIAQYLHFKCDQGTVETLLSPVTATWTTESGDPIGIEKVEQRDQGITYTSEYLESFQAEVQTENLIKIHIELSSGISAFATQRLRFLTSDITVQLKGGSRIHAYQKVLEMRTEIKDPDVNPAIADQKEGITVQWECKKMENLDEDCVDYTQENFLIDTAALENQHEFDIEGRKMEPYKIYQFKVYGQKAPKDDQDDLLVIIAQELDLPALSVKFPTELLSKKVNLNEEIFTTIEYAKEDEYDISILQYSATILYEFEARSTEVFGHKKTRLKIWDHFVDFKRSELLQIRYTVYNPYFMMPSTSVVNLFVNIPAYNCTVSATGDDYKALDSQITFEAQYCVDSNQPLQYKYFFYQSEDDYLQERITPIKQQRLILTDFLATNKFTTFLPQSKYPDKQQIMVINVVDSAGGMNNLTVPIQMQPNPSTTQESYIQNLNNKINQSKLLDLSDQVRYLCILTEDLMLNEIIDIKSQEIILIKKSLIYELNLIKNSLLPSSELDAQIAKALDQLNQDYEAILGDQNSQEISKMLTEQQQFLSIKQEQGSILKLDTRSTTQTMTAEKIETIVESQLKVYDSVLKGTNLIVDRVEVPYIQNSQDNANMKVFNMTAQASDTSMQNMMPNQQSKFFDGGSFKLKSQKITKKNINSYLGTEPTWSGNDEENTGAAIVEDGEDEPITNDDEFFVGFKEFKTNPFASSDLFYYNDTGIPVKDPEIKKSGSSDKINISAPITHDFDIDEENAKNPDKLVCISKDKDDKWDKKQCSSKVYEDDDGNTKAKCVCKDLSIATVVSDTDDIFQDSYIDEVFSDQEDPIFYILMVFSIVIIVSMIYGYQLDKKAQQEVQVVPLDISDYASQHYTQNTQEQEKLDDQQFGEYAKNIQKDIDTSRPMLVNNKLKISDSALASPISNLNNDIEKQNLNKEKPISNNQLQEIQQQTEEEQKFEQDQKQLDDLVKSLDIPANNENQEKNGNTIQIQDNQENAENNKKSTSSDLSNKENFQLDQNNENQQLTQENNENNQLTQNDENLKESQNNDENDQNPQQLVKQQSTNPLLKQTSINQNDQIFKDQDLQEVQVFDNLKMNTQPSQKNLNDTPKSNQNQTSQNDINNNNVNNDNKKDSKNNLVQRDKEVSNLQFNSSINDQDLFSSGKATPLNRNLAKKPSIFYQRRKSKLKDSQDDQKSQKSNNIPNRQNDDLESVYSKGGRKTYQPKKKKTQHLIIYDQKRVVKKKTIIKKKNNDANSVVNDVESNKNSKQNENEDEIIEEVEEVETEPIKLEKKYSILEGIYLYHQFFGIYFSYDPKMSRPVRFSLYYLKILLLMTATGLFASNQADQFMGILLSLITAILAGIPLAICKTFITQQKLPLKIFGILLTATAYGTCFYAITIVAILMERENAQLWQVNYLTSVLIDNAVSQPLMVALKLKLFNLSIGTSLEQPIRSLFKHFGSFFASE